MRKGPGTGSPRAQAGLDRASQFPVTPLVEMTPVPGPVEEMSLSGTLDPGRRIDEGGAGFPDEGADPVSERSAARLDGRGVRSPRSLP